MSSATAQPATVLPPRPAAADAHTDLVAFLFTDIEGSSLKRLNHRAATQDALRVHVGLAVPETDWCATYVPGPDNLRNALALTP